MPSQNKQSKIYVNTREYTVDGPTISYEEVVQLAFPDSEVRYSVSYSDGKGGQDGILRPNQKTPVEEGMQFDVTPTDKS